LPADLAPLEEMAVVAVAWQARAQVVARPKTIAHTGYRNYSPSADINWVAIDVSHTRADLEVIA
jgi:hypothetical protein